MNKMMLAKSYQGSKIVKEFEKSGKPYATIQIECERCGGKGNYFWGAIVNGKPEHMGTCYKCQGVGYELKDVRLYTEKEFNRMEQTKINKMAEQEKKMRADAEVTRRKWLENNGWSQDGVTYIVTGDSYSIKDELKAAGFRFDPVLRWHKAEKVEEYADRLIEVHLDEVISISAWGKGSYNIGAKELIDKKLAATQPESTSRWIGEEGEKIKDLRVQLVRKYSFDGRYGLTTLYGFQDEEGNIINWFSSTVQEIEPGNWITIKTATIKKLDEYKGAKQTILTRCKLVEC